MWVFSALIMTNYVLKTINMVENYLNVNIYTAQMAATVKMKEHWAGLQIEFFLTIQVIYGSGNSFYI